ncbi:hypothetical protein TNCV_1055421 [Trichonephila clavipes]|nr:hypothetical protein TNCV_1055421 [Trichonephila clavipes]
MVLTRRENICLFVVVFEATVVSGYGHGLVAGVPESSVPLKIHHIEGLMNTSSVMAQIPVGVMWKLGEWGASSGVFLVA